MHATQIPMTFVLNSFKTMRFVSSNSPWHRWRKESFIVEMIKNDFLWSFRAKIAQKYRISVPGAHRSQFYSKKWFWFFFARNSKIFSENIEMRLKMGRKNYVLRSHTFLKRGISSVCLLSCFLSMTFQIYSFCLCFFIEYFD